VISAMQVMPSERLQEVNCCALECFDSKYCYWLPLIDDMYATVVFFVCMVPTCK